MTINAYAGIELRGAATTATTTTTTLTILKPTGLSVGDVMIAQIVQSGNNNFVSAIGDATSSGWTKIAGSNIRSANKNYSRATLLYKVANSADINAVNFVFTLDNNSDDGEGGIIAFSGVDGTNIFDVTPGTTYNNIFSDQILNANSITTTSTNSAVIMFGAVHDNFNVSSWNTATSPGNLNELYDVPFDSDIDIGMGAAWALKLSVGATGGGTATINNNAYNGAILIALKPNLKPTITSFTPTNACYGSLASVVITGTNFTGTTAVTFNGVSASFTINSATQITATLPATAATGPISITNSYGTGTSANSFVVNALPTVTASATPTEVCSSSDVTLTASATPVTVTVLSENFNSPTNNWTTINNSTGGTPTNAAWTLRPDNYNPPTFTGGIRSNDQSQYYFSNSNNQGGGITATELHSPSMSTIGFNTLSLNFWHYFRIEDTENVTGKVEVSTDGSNWTTITTYSTTQGTATSFLNPVISLNSYTGNATFYIRFKYDAETTSRYWAIDNVTITGTRTYNYSWAATPSVSAGLPAGAGTPSIGNASIVANPTQNTSYIATAVNTASGCAASSAEIAITVFPTNLLWRGETSSDWHLATNWEPKSVPTACADVTIPSVANNFPTITSAAECNNITIESGASLIDEGSYLTVANKSTMIREISDTRWHFLSSPVEGQEIWPSFAPTPADDPLTFGGEPWLWDFYYYNPNCPLPGKEWVNLRNNDGTYNSGVIDEGSNFAGFGASTPTMTVAKGYLVAYASGSSTHAFEASTPNSFNTGNIGINFSNSKNVYNLIGNPYPSSLDWTDASWTNRSDLETSGGTELYDYWIMNDGVGTISGNYVVFNSGGTGSTSASKDIAPGQGFWVKAAGTGTLNLTIPNAARTHSSQAWLKNGNSEANLIRLHLKTSGNTYSDEMIVDINPVYSGNEGSDKLWSFYAEAPEIYAIKGGNNYTIDRYKDLNTNLTVNIGTKTGIAADYTITATNIQDFNLSSKVLLEDLKTGIVTDLKQSPAYTFAGAPGDEANRFRLIIGSPIGIDEPNTTGSFNIYTYENMVYVQNDKTNEPYFVTVSNMLGQTLVRTDFTGNSLNRIEMRSVPGVYVVNVVSNGKTYSQKVVIR